VARILSKLGVALSDLFLSFLWWRIGLERTKKARRSTRDLLDGAKEWGFVRFRGFVESVDLSHKLERGSSNLLVRDWWIEVEEGLDIPAHAFK
jgi:hypothetical protein